MAKKDLISGINSVLTGTLPKKKLSGEKKIAKSSISSVEDNLQIAMDPASPSSSNTHIVPDKLIGKARYVAHKEGVSVKDVLNQSLARLLTAWEQKNYVITDDMLVAKRSKKTII